MFRKMIGLRIKEIRKNNNLSQLDACWRANINKSYWNDVENGKVNISVLKLKDICNCFNISLKDFFDSNIFDKNNAEEE